MRLIDKLNNINRRVIFGAISLAVIIPLIWPIGLPVRTSEPVKKLYDAIDKLPSGSRVLLSFDYDPSTMPEIYPMNLSIVRHCFAKDIKVVGMALWPMGVSLGELAFDVASEEYNKEYGKDFVNLGFKAGGIVVISSAATSITETFPLDYAGTSIDKLPVMDGVKDFNNFELIISFSAGDPGISAWIMIAQGRYHRPVGGGCTAVSAPGFYPYLQAGQLVGLAGGMKGAAEYEALIGKKGAAIAGMDAQSIAHALIVFFIVFGNVIYFIIRRKK